MEKKSVIILTMQLEKILSVKEMGKERSSLKILMMIIIRNYWLAITFSSSF